MKWLWRKCATQTPFTLSQCGVPTLEKCGSVSELCTLMCARERCASLVCASRCGVNIVAPLFGREHSRETSLERPYLCTDNLHLLCHVLFRVSRWARIGHIDSIPVHAHSALPSFENEPPESERCLQHPSSS